MTNKNNLRVIRTARNATAINNAAKQGFQPLVKAVMPSDRIKSKFAVLQDKTTGEIQVVSDFRAIDSANPDQETVINFTFYYPHHFESPFAAYLIPKSLQVGEHVWLEDLIDDFVAIEWNQGDAYRLNGCEAIWDGNDFIIQYDFNSKRTGIIG